MKILFDVVSGVIMTALFFGPPFAMLFGSFTSHLPVDLSGKFQFSHLQEWLDIVHLTIDAIKKKKRYRNYTFIKFGSCISTYSIVKKGSWKNFNIQTFLLCLTLLSFFVLTCTYHISNEGIHI